LSEGGFSVPSGGGALAENVAKLESDLATEREERCEERFIWIAICYILGSGLLYAAIQSLVVFLVLFLLGLVVLVGIAKRLGVDWAVQGVGWLMHWISTQANFSGKDE
jgi:hypothetical protein